MANVQQLSLLVPQTSAQVANPSDCWYTPNNSSHPVLNLVEKALGGIDLDPCANEERTVLAQRHYTFADNGLMQPWHGNVFMNPPFSRPSDWVNKLVDEMVAGRLTQAIALLKIGCLNNQGTGVAIKTHAAAICHWHHNGRIKFVPGVALLEERARQGLGAPGSADFDTVLVYWGDRVGRFAEVFDDYGMVTQIMKR